MTAIRYKSGTEHCCLSKLSVRSISMLKLNGGFKNSTLSGMSWPIRRFMTNKNQFVAVTRKLVRGLLREAVGYSVEFEIPYYQGTVGFMVEAPMLWIRHSRFP